MPSNPVLSAQCPDVGSSRGKEIILIRCISAMYTTCRARQRVPACGCVSVLLEYILETWRFHHAKMTVSRPAPVIFCFPLSLATAPYLNITLGICITYVKRAYAISDGPGAPWLCGPGDTMVKSYKVKLSVTDSFPGSNLNSGRRLSIRVHN